MKYKRIIAVTLLSAGVAAILKEHYCRKKIEILKQANEKMSDNYQLLNHWLEVRNEGRSVVDYFKNRGYKHIAIYGMAELANRLSEELESSEVQIDYGIDRDVSCTISRIEEVYSMQDEWPMADVIVVTPYYAFESIRRDLQKKTDCPIISIEDVIWSV